MDRTAQTLQEDDSQMDIDGTYTTVTGLPSRPQAAGVRPSQAGEFARVYELADHRRRRMTGPDRIPEEVWDDINRANELAQTLAERGERVRFETHHLTGRVVASLCDSDGNVVRGMGLAEIVGLEPDPAPAA
jgi:hypothetical protein